MSNLVELHLISINEVNFYQLYDKIDLIIQHLFNFIIQIQFDPT